MNLILNTILFLIPVTGSELLPMDTPVSTAVDYYLDLQMQKGNIRPAVAVDDSILIRRTMLDLVGRIPTSVELDEYVQSNDPDKRRKLVDHLLQTDAYRKHLAYDLNLLLAPVGNSDLREYLEIALTERRGWDQMFTDMLGGEYKDSTQRLAMNFVKLRVKDLDNLTNATSSLFFGVNISCAKCHDHPLVTEWTQAHFYGMKSFFNRSFENGDFVGERSYGGLTYQNTSGEQLNAKLMFLTGDEIAEPDGDIPNDEQKKAENKLFEQLKKDKKPVPVPEYSRRTQLLNAALREDERSYFSRSIVNRLWYRTFGFGLVMPLDQMHPDNPASHPELLQWLARDMKEHHYDLNRLIRGFVLTKAYARSSQYTGEKRPGQMWFAVANVKPLSPEQYASALLFATRNPGQFVTEDLDEREKQIAAVQQMARGFASRFDVPGSEFQVSVDEALLFSNDTVVQDDLVAIREDRLTGELVKMESNTEIVMLAVKTIFNRAPTGDEKRNMLKYLKQRKDRKEAAISQLVWALLTSSEVRFNY